MKLRKTALFVRLERTITYALAGLACHDAPVLQIDPLRYNLTAMRFFDGTLVYPSFRLITAALRFDEKCALFETMLRHLHQERGPLLAHFCWAAFDG